MPHIPDEILEQIRLRADIVDVVQSYVPTLKKAGAAWKACCPFHAEKTPSFTVNASRQSYKCFGCGKGGNVFSFIMEMEKLDFPNAAEFLARKYGVVIPTEPARTRRGYSVPSAKPEADYNLRERLYTLHEKLAAWYASNLTLATPVPEVAAYFQTRLIPEEFTRRFQIGGAPDSWDAAIGFAHREGFTDDELKLAGIVSEKEDHPGHIYDRFRNRLVFPIWNEQGRVVAFSCRSVERDPKGWKYMNSPETPVFKKSRTLYALHFARVPIAEKKFAILCEGQLDVIAMHRAGCDNAIAAQGTAFGEEHAAILKRYTGEICLALDNDAAGKKAVFADAAILLPHGFQLKVVSWPGGKDADELLKTQGPEVIRSAVENAVDFFEFAYRHAAEENDVATPAGKAAVAAALIDRILLLESAAARASYLDWLAGKLALDPAALRLDMERKSAAADRTEQFRERYRAERENELARKTAPAPRPVPAKKQLSERDGGIRAAYRDLLSLLLSSEELAAAAVHDVKEEYCDATPVGRAIDIVIQSVLDHTWADASQRILMELAKEGLDLSEVAALITEEPAGSAATEAQPENESKPDSVMAMLNFGEAARENGEQLRARRRAALYADCIRKIRMESLHAGMEELTAYAGTLSDDDPEKREILKQIFDCARQLRDLSRGKR